ncbi:unnamed protein product [Protopolystoma xenopodis]|uniref:DEAD/DEAH-box helicase domain-containing protein n=1 Tax=Protopolystoma xenopodis TaxID=117903 RepID=A0A448XE79_9PLAT|nr:unnamed protein product [Protopolystoma xenopodis]
MIHLPEGTKVDRSPLCEIVNFPIPEKPPDDLIKTPLIRVKDLDTVGQLLFDGIKKLNLVQSVVFETAYNTSENMLLAAPTGSGKTNVALLAIGQLIRQNMLSEGVVNVKDFKVLRRYEE